MPPVEIYKGSKNFWRIRANVDFHFIEHEEFKCIEVISFNPTLHAEAPRIFISIPVLAFCLGDMKIEDTMSRKREDMTRKRQPRIHVEELRKLAIRELAVEFILSNCQVEVNAESQCFETSIVCPGEEISSLIIPQPEILREHKIERGGRLVSTKDFHNSMKELRTDARKLAQASNAAERLISLKALAVDGFKQLMDVSHFYSDEMSPAHRRWVRAIRRVIAQNYVAMFTAKLEEIEQKKEAQVLKVNKLGFLASPINPGADSSAMSSRRGSLLSQSFSGISNSKGTKAMKSASRASFDGFALPHIDENNSFEILSAGAMGGPLRPPSLDRNPNRRTLGMSKSLSTLPEKDIVTWHHHDPSLIIKDKLLLPSVLQSSRARGVGAQTSLFSRGGAHPV